MTSNILLLIQKHDSLEVTRSNTYTEIALWYHRYDGVIE